MPRGLIILLMVFLLAMLPPGIHQGQLQAKELQQLDLVKGMVFSVVPKDSGRLLHVNWPHFLGSKSFRNGRVYPFFLEYELGSWGTLLAILAGIYDFHELDMQVFPWDAPQLKVQSWVNSSETAILRAQLQVALFEERPEPGFDSFPLWERPFALELMVFDEKEIFTVIDAIRNFRHARARLDLEPDFSVSITPKIDPDGREYLQARLSVFFIPFQEGMTAGKSSEWDVEGRLRQALQFLMKSPRFKKGLSPAGRNSLVSLWFQELRTERQPDGSSDWKIQGLAWNPKDVVEFVKELRVSGHFGEARIDSLTTSYLAGCDILLSNFKITASLP